jgi:cyclophilin family peptidyl-prolyl cis-trans isomerase
VGTEKRERQRANRQLKNQQLAQEEHRRRFTRRLVIGAIAVVAGVGLVFGIAALGGAFSGDEDDPVASSVPDVTTPGTATGSTVPGSAPASTAPGSTVALAPFAYGTGECPPEEVTEPVRTFDAAPQECIDPAATYTATFRTSEGDIVVDLDTASVPGTVNNFVTLARYGYYDDTLIFRADPSIDIIQGGGRSNTDSPGYEIPDEANGFTYQAGQLAMARTQAPNSAGGQWFFVTGPNGANLDAQGTYVVFGEISEGLDVAQSILALSGDDGQTPSREVTLETVEITES